MSFIPSIRFSIKSLARAGLIEIRSNNKNLIVKCHLADTKLPIQTSGVVNAIMLTIRVSLDAGLQ